MSTAMDSNLEYRTTKPIIPHYSQRSIIHTSNPRLFLRPYRKEDLAPIHELRSQIEVMKWSSQLTIDADIDATKKWMLRSMEASSEWIGPDSVESTTEKLLTPNPSIIRFNFVLMYVPESQPVPETVTVDSGIVIGCGGVHNFTPEYECGYMIRKEFWGKGIGTVAVKALLEAWWGLERETITVSVERAKELKDQGGDTCIDEEQKVMYINETVHAEVVDTNVGSRRILDKCNFFYRKTEVLFEKGENVNLMAYGLNRPGFRQVQK